ncbi:glycosyltransferase family 2 protein [Paenibacillus turpanensis]|uniref:glycosyltransferase family 2 protein n=1 Tax=Paenibacillus turpanensis TaxID=2689078 RepID=UPI00140BDA3B|nr:glycosyltransferase family 2 protein [Paenibacillus turpanensis]
MKVLVIIPAYNEEENIGLLLSKVIELRDVINMEILVINDKSTDRTYEKCKEYNEVTIIDLPCNLGIGGAVQTGYKYAKKNNFDIAIQVDGDGQHDPRYIPDLVQLLENNDMVIGSRFIEKEGFQSTKLRRIGIKYFSSLIKLFTGSVITDPTSGYRACNRQVIELFSNRYPQDYPEPESILYLLRNRYRIKETPVLMNERTGGVSSINPIRSVYYMIKVSLAIFIDTLRKKLI